MDNLKELLECDPLADAEQLTGKSYKSDEATVNLGMAMMFLNNQKKQQALQAANDTYFGSTLDEYLAVVADLGFTLINQFPFETEHGNEFHYWFWHYDYSILLVFDTFGGKSVNGGKFHYCHKPNLDEGGLFQYPDCYSSGGFSQDNLAEKVYIWTGDHDCREGLRFHINQLLAAGSFQKQWIGDHFVWPFNYKEVSAQEHLPWMERYENREQLLAERLPVDILKLINKAR